MPAGNTYEAIATTTLGSSGTVTFSSIPGTYTDLRLIAVGGTTRAATSDTIRIQFNSDTGTNYSSTYILGNGSSASSGRNSSSSNLFVEGIRLVGTTYGLNSMFTLDIMNYSNTTTFKTAIGRSNLPEQFGTTAAVGLWRSTSAITSIYLQGDTVANFAIGTTFSLYGVKNA